MLELLSEVLCWTYPATERTDNNEITLSHLLSCSHSPYSVAPGLFQETMNIALPKECTL